jgi:galactosyl transferase GMA12/MNN10 family
MMKLFIDLWSDPLIVERTPAWVQREQDALTYMIVHHPHLRDKVGFLPQSLINSYTFQWQPGNLLVHFAGCWYSPP